MNIKNVQYLGRIKNLSILFLLIILLIAPGKVKADGNFEFKGSIQAKSDSSITVNMIEIFIDSSTQFHSDSNSNLTFADLKVGDFVKVKTTSVVSGSVIASQIILLNHPMSMELRGSITAITSNSFTVNNKEVFVDSNTVIQTLFHAALEFGDLEVGNSVIVKVSNSNGGYLFASLIMVITIDIPKEVEIAGKIQAITDSSITVQDITFAVSSRTIIVSDEHKFLNLTDLTVGLDVSIRGFMKQDSAYAALLIKVEDDDFTRNDLNLEGTIMEIDSTKIVVNNVTCFVDSSTIVFAHFGAMLMLSDLNAGDLVKVKAVLQSDGTYKAVKIMLFREKNEIELSGEIEMINSDNFVVGGNTIYVNSETKIYNHSKHDVPFGDLTVGTFVVLKAYYHDGKYYASKIKVRDAGKTEIHITGAVDAIAGDTITVRGVVFLTDENTEYVDYHGITITKNDLKVGQIIRIEGTVQNGNQYYAQSIKIINFWRSAVVVEGMIDSLGISSIKVSDKIFLVDSTTIIIGHGIGIIDFAGLTLGLKVEIKGTIDVNGNLVAKLIKVHPPKAYRVEGTIDTIYASTFIVAGVTINTDDKTVFYDEFCNTITFDSLKIGQTVEVKYVKESIGGNLAVKVEIEKEPGSVEFNGIVTAITSGNIKLSVPSFMLNSETVFISSAYTPISSASIQVGQTVTIWANQDDNGNLEAVQVLQMTGGVTGVNDNQSKLPTEFDLSQNYPNPFNPSTKISFTLSKSVDVVLKVYNIIGQEVANLVNGKMNAGKHVVSFDGSNLASGVYFYRLKAGDFVSVKKMLLLK